MKENKNTRNANGMGTTYYDEKKQRFVSQMFGTNKDGESKRLTATSKKSGKEAHKRVEEKVKKYSESSSGKGNLNSKTVFDLACEYIQYKEMEGLRESTLKNYTDYCNGYIKDSPIEKMEISSITKENLLSFYSELLRNGNKRKKAEGTECGLTAVTVNHVLILLKGCFSYAVENGYIQKDPHNGIKKYKDRYKDDREKAFTSEEISKLTSNSKNKEDIFYNMFCLILS